MAAGLTDHVWPLREVLRFRVPPWPQPQALCVAGEHDDHGAERGRCVCTEGKKASQGPTMPDGETVTVLVTSRWRLRTGPSHVSAR
jgi:hypothetical protein